MPARLPDAERSALHAAYDPIDARNREIRARIEQARIDIFGRDRVPRPDTSRAWMDPEGFVRGHVDDSQWEALSYRIQCIHAELGPYQETPRLVGRWLWLRMFALSHRAPARRWTLEDLVQTYDDEPVSGETWREVETDAFTLAEGWPRFDSDALADLYIEARRRIEPFLQFAPSLGIPALDGLPPP